MGRRVGLLGGTFDPPHWGHLWLAETAWEQLGLDLVLFLPVGQPPHKQGRRVTAVSHRLHMIQLAIENISYFTLDRSDVEREPPHATYSLLPLMRHAYPDAQFWLLLGADSLQSLPHWQKTRQLIEQCRLAALPRPGVAIDWQILETAVPGIETAVDLLAGPTLDISSTEIRHWARAGHSLHYLLPTAVLDYIQQNNLFSEQSSVNSHQ